MQIGAGHDIIKIEIDIPYKKFKVRTSNKKLNLNLVNVMTDPSLKL